MKWGVRKPKDISTWNKVGQAEGSNPGGYYRDPAGTKYYVKFYASNEQGQSEILANSIYNSLKLGAPDSFQVSLDGKPGVASVVIPSLEPTTISQLKNTSNENTVKAGFVADAYLANWDVVGLTSDNIFKNPTTLDYVRIDNGGSMFFRAQGAPKNYGPVVNELESMRNPDTAKQAGKVFQGLTDEDLKPQAKELTTILTDDKIKELVANAGFEGDKATKYENVLKARRDDIASTLLGQNKPPAEAKPEPTGEPPGPKPSSTSKSASQDDEDTGTKGKWGEKMASKYAKEPNPKLAAGYFQHSSFRGKLYSALEAAKGDWLKLSDLKTAHQDSKDIDRWVGSLKRWGQRTGRWSVEISGDQIRMFVTPKTAGAIKPQSEEETSKIGSLAKDAAHQIVTGSFADSQQFYSKYFQDAGVSENSKIGAYEGVEEWTSSVNAPQAQALRKVAMDYYGRNPDWEYTDGNTNYFKHPSAKYTQSLNDKASTMKDGVMAMKSLTGAVAKEKGITVLYRGISGQPAKEILAQIKDKGFANVPVNSLSSWSDSKKKASSFGSVVLKLKVDTDNLWASHEATPWLFSAHPAEREWIVGFHQPKEKFTAGDIEQGDKRDIEQGDKRDIEQGDKSY